MRTRPRVGHRARPDLPHSTTPGDEHKPSHLSTPPAPHSCGTGGTNARLATITAGRTDLQAFWSVPGRDQLHGFSAERSHSRRRQRLPRSALGSELEWHMPGPEAGRHLGLLSLSALVRLQVAIALPLRNVLAEVVPLCLLCAGEALEDVITEGFPDQRVGLHLSDGLAQCRW
jgi:hypothetical protein